MQHRGHYKHSLGNEPVLLHRLVLSQLHVLKRQLSERPCQSGSDKEVTVKQEPAQGRSVVGLVQGLLLAVGLAVHHEGRLGCVGAVSGDQLLYLAGVRLVGLEDELVLFRAVLDARRSPQFVVDDGQVAEELANEGGERLDVVGGLAVLAEDPEGAAHDLDGLDGGEDLEELLQDEVLEAGELVDDLANEGEDVACG